MDQEKKQNSKIYTFGSTYLNIGEYIIIKILNFF